MTRRSPAILAELEAAAERPPADGFASMSILGRLSTILLSGERVPMRAALVQLGGFAVWGIRQIDDEAAAAETKR